ncbi:MAG TPA: SDR family oxidoreductase [Geothrix sp.]|nr:SDR family oxidoreductase [Geothrix sp.]
MKTAGNIILITGGGSGIGRGLAEAFHARGNQVLIASRRQDALDETTKANPGMASYVVDLQDAEATREFAARVTREHPGLNVLINNSGIMRPENLLAQDQGLADMEAIVATNLLGPIRLTAALLPHLRAQIRSAIMNVSSGLAFVPMAPTPTYCATKAALHSYTQSLRYQLKDTAVEVLELIPPYVATHLMNGASDPRAMPLAAFIAEAMAILDTQPGQVEICVENVKRLRFAAETGKYQDIFQGFNDAMAANPH